MWQKCGKKCHVLFCIAQNLFFTPHETGERFAQMLTPVTEKKKFRESSASLPLCPRLTDKKSFFFIILLFSGKCKNPAETRKNSLTVDLLDFYGFAMTVYCKSVT
jgi:hypothetical protein